MDAIQKVPKKIKNLKLKKKAKIKLKENSQNNVNSKI